MTSVTFPNYFINRGSGALVRVKEVDDTFAYLEILAPEAAAYAMPVADYDSVFVQMFRPATADDLRTMTSAKFRPPKNAPAEWHT